MGPTDLKKGDVVLLKYSCNGYTNWYNIPLEITSRNNQSYNVRQIDNPNAGQIQVHHTGNPDEFTLYSRTEQAEYLKTKVASMKKEIVSMEAEADRLANFETEEDYVAFKIDEMLKAQKKGGAGAIAEVLKQLKASHLL
jgi:hypothetical protein